jgi:hypothetical protein
MKKLQFMLITVFIFANVFIISNCELEEPEETTDYFTFSSQISTYPPIKIYLGWTERAATDEYVLYRSINTLDSYIERTITTLNTFTDTDVTWGTKYYYKIGAKRSGKEIFLSGNYEVTMPPEPKGLTSSDAIWLNRSSTDYLLSDEINNMWFKFSGGGLHTIRILDRAFTGDKYTSDVVVDILTTTNNNNLVTITIDGKMQSNIDSSSITASNWFGLYYVRVKPKNNDPANKGTFAIYYY